MSITNMSQYYFGVLRSGTNDGEYDRLVMFSPAPGAVQYGLEKFRKNDKGEVEEEFEYVDQESILDLEVFKKERPLAGMYILPPPELDKGLRAGSSIQEHCLDKQLRPGQTVLPEHLDRAWRGLVEGLKILNRRRIYVRHGITVDLRSPACQESHSLRHDLNFNGVSKYDEIWIAVAITDGKYLRGYIGIHHDMRNIPSTVVIYDFHSKRNNPESPMSIGAKEWYVSFIDGSTAVPEDYDWPIAWFTFQAGQEEGTDGAYILKVAAVKLLGCRLPREWPPAPYAPNRPLNIPENANRALSITNYSIMPSRRDNVYINALMGLVPATEADEDAGSSAK